MTAYEKGAANNLVKFSNFNDLAFEDTGVAIDDSSPPSKNILWSSEKINTQLENIINYINQIPKQEIQQIQPQEPIQNDKQFRYNINKSGARIQGPYGGYIDVGLPPNFKRNFRGLQYRRSKNNTTENHRLPKILHPSYLASFLIPNRQHYCDKCNNYLEHSVASRWKDSVNPGSSCGKQCNCSVK